MRKLLVGACCVIVGLQVVALAAAMLVVGVLAALGGVRTPFAVRNSGPAVYVDDPLIPTPGFPVERTAWEQPLADAPANRAPSDPVVESILEYREQVGSPLAGTLLEGDASSPAASREMEAILARVSADSPTNVRKSASSAEAPSIPLPLAASAGVAVEGLAGASSPLAAAVDHLYAQASQHESRGEYPRADQLRELARSIRREIEIGGAAHRPAIVPDLPREPREPENPVGLPAAELETAESAIPAS